MKEEIRIIKNSPPTILAASAEKVLGFPSLRTAEEFWEIAEEELKINKLWPNLFSVLKRRYALRYEIEQRATGLMYNYEFGRDGLGFIDINKNEMNSIWVSRKRGCGLDERERKRFYSPREEIALIKERGIIKKGIWLLEIRSDGKRREYKF